MFYLDKLFNSITLVWMEFELGRLSAVGEGGWESDIEKWNESESFKKNEEVELRNK